MIHSTGVDLVSVDRIRDLQERHGPRFLDRVYTPGELALCQQRQDPAECLAARFAAKEAVLKCLGTGQAEGLTLLQVEVIRDARGAVTVRLHGAAAERAGAEGVLRIHLSLSHERGRAIAFAVAESAG